MTKIKYEDRVIRLIKELEWKDEYFMKSLIMFMEAEVIRTRRKVIDLELSIVTLYEDIQTIQSLINNK